MTDSKPSQAEMEKLVRIKEECEFQYQSFMCGESDGSYIVDHWPDIGWYIKNLKTRLKSAEKERDSYKEDAERMARALGTYALFEEENPPYDYKSTAHEALSSLRNQYPSQG